jgi:ERCC4-type nuclease
MKLVLDNREHLLYDKIQAILFTTPNSDIQVTFEPIPLGDIIIKTPDDKIVLIIERKSMLDLLSSIKDGRYDEQSYRLSHSNECCPHNILYLIEGMFSVLRSQQEKKMCLSAIISLNHFKGFSIFRTTNIQETAEMVLAFCDKLRREYEKGKNGFYMTPRITNTVESITDPENLGSLSPVLEQDHPNPIPPPTGYANVVKKVKKENVTLENIGEIILSQIPGISSVTATAIIRHFGSLVGLIEKLKNPDLKKEFENITYMTNGKMRRIGKTAYESIIMYFNPGRQEETPLLV